MISTADLLDAHGDEAAVCATAFRQFGGVRAFAGEIATVRCDEDNVLVSRRAGEPGKGRVLVVDGGGSLHCALVGAELDVPVTFGGVTFRPGARITSDDDGVVVLAS